MASRTFKMEPEVAAALFLKDHDAIHVRLDDLLTPLRMTLADILPDLQSGLLVGTLIGDEEHGIDDFKTALAEGEIYFTGSALVRWFEARPELLARMGKRE